jgi:urea transporter
MTMMATLLSHHGARRFSVRFSAPRLGCPTATNPHTAFYYRRAAACFGTVSSKKDSKNDNEEENGEKHHKHIHTRTPSPAAAPVSPANASAWQVSSTVDAAAKGVGQVLFLNDRRAGAIILGSLALGGADPYLAFLAGTGTVVANATAAQVGLDRTALQNGLFGYNGCLVGCATAVFICPVTAAASMSSSMSTLATAAAGICVTATGAATSTMVAASLPAALGKVPQYTLAFNLVMLSVLLQTRPLLATATAATVSTSTSTVVDSTSTVTTDAVVAVTPVAADAVLTTMTMGQALVAAPLHGLSQIFVVESAWTGAGVLVAIASYSPQLAAHALVGSIVGSLTGGCVLMAAPADIAAGLWGYNSALTSMAVGVFLVSADDDHHTGIEKKSDTNTPPSRQAAVAALSMGGAAATAVVFGALQTVFGAAWAPCLTLPFCLTASGCYLLAAANDGGVVVPGLQLAAHPHSPEQNRV